jgi:hypothetical protein
MSLWITGKHLTTAENGDVTWDFMGVFDSEEKAVAAAISWECFVAPATLNLALPLEPENWTGFYFPQARAYKLANPDWEPDAR